MNSPFLCFHSLKEKGEEQIRKTGIGEEKRKREGGEKMQKVRRGGKMEKRKDGERGRGRNITKMDLTMACPQ